MGIESSDQNRKVENGAKQEMGPEALVVEHINQGLNVAEDKFRKDKFWGKTLEVLGGAAFVSTLLAAGVEVMGNDTMATNEIVRIIVSLLSGGLSFKLGKDMMQNAFNRLIQERSDILKPYLSSKER